MNRILAPGLVLAVLLGGCQDGPRATAHGQTPAAAAAPVAVPDPLQGTWRQEGVGFLALGTDTAIVNLPGLPRRPARITGMVAAGDHAAGLTLDNGWTLTLAAGRAVTSRRLGGVELAADCPVLDLAVEGPGTSGSWRLWNDGATTWLPLAGAPQPAVAMAPAPAEAPAAPAVEDRLVTAVAALGDEPLLTASRALVALAASGAPRPRLEDQIGETLRRQRLAALDLLAGPEADEYVLLRADQAITRLDAWQRLTRTWLDGRG